jgi:hypothetical protein
MGRMTKPQGITREKLVRDSKTGRYVTVRGAGALKGHLSIKKGLDLTKPIASQALKGSRVRKGNSAHDQG